MPKVKPVIVIVEDEFLLRMDSVEILEDGGFEVVPAANADEAIAILSARSDIHLVFTDIRCRDRWTGWSLPASSGTAGRRSR